MARHSTVIHSGDAVAVQIELESNVIIRGSASDVNVVEIKEADGGTIIVGSFA
jgi:hypothetical protein